MYLVKNSKSPNYQVIYFINGKRTTISTKTKDKRKAKKFLESFKKSTKSPKEFRIRTVVKKEKVIYLSEFRDEYLAYVIPTKSEKYVKSIKLSFRQLENFLSDIPLNRIDVRTLDRFITNTFSRTEKGASLYYRTLKAAFTRAESWGYISENPLKKVKFPRVSKNYPVFISVEEFNVILSSTREEYLKDLFNVAFYTGMRLGEIINMKLSWIDLHSNIITVKNGKDFQTKSKKERVIPFNQNLKNIFLESINNKKSMVNVSYVFTNSNGIKLNEDFVSKQFKKSVRRAELNDKIHFHTLRHSFASILVQKGVSLYVVKELLGHADLSTTQIYSHLQQDNLVNAVCLLQY